MKTAKWMMLLACAVIGTGLYAEDQKPERRPGKRPGMRPDISALLGLNKAEKKAEAEAEAAVKEAVKKIRDKALEDAKKVVGENFDAKLKTYKEAVARMTDAEQKARAGRMLARMEANRDRLVTRIATQMMTPERGRRPGFGGPDGRRPMMPPRPPEKMPAAK